jgi:hypothetical protein
MVGCCECGDEPSGSADTELVSRLYNYRPFAYQTSDLSTNGMGQ